MRQTDAEKSRTISVNDVTRTEAWCICLVGSTSSVGHSLRASPKKDYIRAKRTKQHTHLPKGRLLRVTHTDWLMSDAPQEIRTSMRGCLILSCWQTTHRPKHLPQQDICHLVRIRPGWICKHTYFRHHFASSLHAGSPFACACILTYVSMLSDWDLQLHDTTSLTHNTRV